MMDGRAATAGAAKPAAARLAATAGAAKPAAAKPVVARLAAALLAGALLAAGALAGCCGSGAPATEAAATTAAATTAAATEAAAEATTGAAAAGTAKVRVGATEVPHAEILNAIKASYEAQGYELEIVSFTDYVQPNLALDTGDLDANYFQHRPYLEDFNAQHGTKIVPLGDVHYEPLGIYPGKAKSLAEVADGAKVAVPNDATNEARALMLLEANGLIKLRDGAGLAATKLDVAENPKGLDIVELEAAQIPRSLGDVDIAAINGNYALEAGLNAAKDALAVETQDSLAADTFANFLAVREGDEGRPELVALLAALQSEEARAFIDEEYEGAVVAKF
jgi:D-methionine transport system substrate-binding protein